MDKAIIFTILILILAGFLFWGFQTGFFSEVFSGKPVVMPEGIILFYGEGCPHCKIVDDFITENKIEEKVSFSRMEVWSNKDNQQVLLKAAQICNLNTDSIGVPFLYDGKNCLVGDVDIINFFKNEANIQ